VLGASLAVAAALAGAGEPGGSPLRTLEHSIHEQVDRHRGEIGLAPLRRHAGLDAIARRHSQDMASGKVAFGHAGLGEREAQAERLLSLFRLAENASEHPEARLDAVPAEALEIWLESPAHRANLEGSFELTGIGAAANGEGGIFVTQIFVLEQPAPAAAASRPAH